MCRRRESPRPVWKERKHISRLSRNFVDRCAVTLIDKWRGFLIAKWHGSKAARACRSWAEPRNRGGADIVAARD